MFSKITLGLVMFWAAGFASCKKDFNCVCHYEILGVEQTPIHEIQDVKRETARDKCAEFEAETQILNPGATCDLE